ELAAAAAKASGEHCPREVLPPWLPPLHRWLHLLDCCFWNRHESPYRIQAQGVIWWKTTKDGCVVANLDLQALTSSSRRRNPICRYLRNQALARGLRPGEDAIEVYCFRMRDLWGASLNALDGLLASTATDSTQGGERVRNENLPTGAIGLQENAPVSPPPSNDL